MAIKMSEDDARRMPRVEDLRPWSPIEPAILSHRRRRRGGTLYYVVPSPAAMKAIEAAGWRYWSALIEAPDVAIEEALRSVHKQKRREVLGIVGDLRAWSMAKPGEKLPLHSWEASEFRKDCTERDQKKAREAAERGPGSGIQQATYLSLGEARVIQQLLEGRGDPASVSALKKIEEVVEGLESYEKVEIDPGFDAVVWEEVNTEGGYRIRLPDGKDRITRCSDTIWRRWDATVLGVVISLVDSGWGTYQAWRNLETDPVMLCESWASIEDLKHPAYRKVESSLPAPMPGGMLREKVEKVSGGAVDSKILEIEYRVLQEP